MPSGFVTARNALAAALQAASLPLSPQIEAKWLTTRQKVRGQQADIALPETTPLITVTLAERGAHRISDRSYASFGVIAIGLRANCATEDRANELDDLIEHIIDAAWQATWSATAAPPLEEIIVPMPCAHDLLNESKLWVAEIHCLIGQRKENA